ncbi:MAG: polysaccharide biosynthesis protein [Dethiobacter sp.]|nr:polysaccharide biosynthesis protein [Dethiobacter sp.]
MTKHSFVKGAVILTMAGLSVRLMGAVFRVVLAMLISDEGVGLFQMAYPVYSTLLAISTAGIPIAISKLVAENLARDDYHGAYRIFRVALVILALFGLVISAVLFFGAGFFARTVGQDPRAALALAAISPAIFLVTVLSAYRGFFQGQQQMMPTALSQIAEQFGRVFVALLLVVVLLPRGLEQAAAGASFGAAAGALAGLLVLLLIWGKQKPSFMEGLRRQRKGNKAPFSTIIYQILTLSVPITLGSLVLPLITIVDLSIVPQRLHSAGFDTSRSTALYGQLTGMAGPLVHIPTIITVALAISLVPAISEAVALKRIRQIQDRSYLAVRMTLLLGLPAALGLYLLAEPITVLLFQNAEAGAALATMSLGVVFLTLFQTTSGILQGLGRPMEPVKSLIYGALVKTALTWNLTANAAFHIRGAALATVIGFGLAAVLNVYRVHILTGMPLYAVNTIVKPLAASGGMGAAVVFVYRRLENLHILIGPTKANALATLASIATGILVYVLILFIIGGIKRQDLEAIPRVGPKLAEIAKKLFLLRG